MAIDLKKIDDKDFIFINKSSNEKEDILFSKFLKNRNRKSLKKNDSLQLK